MSDKKVKDITPEIPLMSADEFFGMLSRSCFAETQEQRDAATQELADKYKTYIDKREKLLGPNCNQ